MNGNNFASIRRIFWLGIGVAVVLAGCGTTTVAPTALPTPAITPDVGGPTWTVSYATPAITPAIDKRIETPLPAATPTAPALPTANIRVGTSVPPKSPTASPTVQHNTPTLEPTPTPIPTFLAACPTPILASSIVHRDGNTGWRHYWASSSQIVFVNTLTIDGQWLWIATTKGIIRLNQHSLEYQLYPSTGTSPDMALDRVYTLAVDDQGRLWAGGSRGLARYTNTTGWERIYNDDYSMPNFALDHEGNLWYWRYQRRFRTGTLYRFQGQEPPAVGDWKPEHLEWKEPSKDPADWRFLALERAELPKEQSGKDARGNTWSWEYDLKANELAIYRNGRITQTISPANSDYAVIVAEAGVWIRLGGDRLFYSDGQSLQQYRFADSKAAISPPRVSSLAFTADGNGWAVTSEGLFHFSNETEKWETTKVDITPFEETAIKLVVSNQQSSLWAYHDRYNLNYLAYFDGQLWKRWPITLTLSGCWRATPKTVIEYQGDIWFTTSNNKCGVWHFDGQILENMKLPPINSLATDHNTKLYATESKGTVLVYDGTDWQRLPDCTECRELGLSLGDAIAADATGRVWATYYKVVGKQVVQDPDILDEWSYYSQLYYYNSSIWRYSADQGWCQILTLDPGPYVRSLLIDAYGDLWILHSSAEVLHCDHENCEAWTFGDNQPFDAPITAMAMDPQGRIWVGGCGLLSVYDPAAEQ